MRECIFDLLKQKYYKYKGSRIQIRNSINYTHQVIEVNNR